MKEGKTVLALISARGGSKGIPHKNIVPLGGKPLLAHSIDAVLNHPLVDRVAVSTDDPIIAEVAKEYGAEVPFLRPREMAKDRSTLADVVTHAIEFYEKECPIDVLIQLYPTSPFRSRRLIDNCILPVIQGKVVSASTMIPVSVQESPPVQVIEGRIQVLPVPKPTEALYQSMGSVAVLDRTRRCKGMWPYSGIMVPLDNPIEQIDIDTPEDLRLARAIIELGLWTSEDECGRVA